MTNIGQEYCLSIYGRTVYDHKKRGKIFGRTVYDHKKRGGIPERSMLRTFPPQIEGNCTHVFVKFVPLKGTLMLNAFLKKSL